MDKDELLKQEVEKYISSTPTEGPKDFIVYKVKVGENTFIYVVEHKNELSSSDWVKMYEGTERDCYRAVGYLDSADRNSEQMEKAKAIMNIGYEGVKHWGIVAGHERPFAKEAEKLFFLFFEKADQFLNEDKDEDTSHQEGRIEQDL